MSLVFNTPKTTLNTTTKDIQNINSECPPCPECDLETGSAEYTENGSYTLSPEEADGFSSVSITVDVPSDVNNQEKTVTITSNGQSTVTADSGYTGLSSVGVTVNVDTTTPYNEGYAAGETAQKAKLTSTTITENGTTTREDGFNSVTVNVQPDLETKTASYNANGQYTITPTAGKDGISEATVTVAVPSDVNNQNKTVTPTTSSQSVTADSGYSGLGTVTVNGVTSAIDQNITANNIRNGVTILGVTGTVTEGITPTGNINITNTNSTDVTNYATAQVVDANLTAGNIKSGTTILGVQGSYDPQPTLQAKTVNPSTSQQVITADTGNDGLSQVTVTAVTASIDQNIQPENILAGVEILGVEGTDGGYGNGYSAGYDDGYAQGQSECPTPTYTSLAEIITQNGTYTYDPNDYGGSSYDFFDGATITVNVSGGGSSCVDLASIGFTCNDLAPINADLPEIVAIKTRLDNGEEIDLTTVDSNTGYNLGENLLFIPSGTYKRCEMSETALFAGDITMGNFNNTGNSYGSFFNGCRSLVSIRSLAPATGIGFLSTNNLFQNCASLQTAPTINTSLVTDAKSTYNGCHRLTSGFVTSFPLAGDCANVFADCYEIQSFPALDFSSATTLAAAFTVSKFPTPAGYSRTFTSITTSNALTNCQSMFNNNGITTCPIFNTSNVTTFRQMFSGCRKLTAVPALDYGNGQSFYGFLSGCESLTTIPLMDMHSATDIQNMMNFSSKADITIGGFENLGKAFTGSNANQHTLDLTNLRGLTKQNIMNVINNLAAPDNTSASGLRLFIRRNIYDLLTAEEIAIATDKGWTVTPS